MQVEERKLGRQTVGRKLRETRKAQNRSLGEVERAIKVHAHHIEALESGDYEALPDPLWGRGFLITYANYLGLDGESLADELFPLRRPSQPQRYLRRHWRALVAALGAIGVAAAMIIAMVVAPYNPFTGWVGGTLEGVAPGIFLGNEPQRVVILGLAQSGTTGQENVLLVNVAKDSIGLRSIPRDTPASIPGHGRGEIGDTFALGGPDLTRRSIEQVVGNEVPYYCVVSSEGIREIIGSMGGVRIKVPQPMSGRAVPGGKEVTLPQGQQTVGGEEALVYLQGKDLPDDAERAKRQQDFLYAMFRQTLGPSNLLANPASVKVVLDNTETNMSGVQTVQLIGRVRALKGSGEPVVVSYRGNP